ncbi:Armadillo-like helical [Corchorus olitorius]|uniref:Armadillo-like helical n=1 Tax=Corchorus olitorius TaxID=93759 RepID=A0A1R3JU96_9ROSI|nr:Armadillo-like helical [Corchorus olitorius]
MSFSFFKPSRPKTPQEVAKAIKDSLMALDTKTVVEVKALEKDGIDQYVYCNDMDKDLLTKHGTVVSEYLTAHYDELLSEFLLEPPNSHIMKRYILEVRYLKVMMTLLKVLKMSYLKRKRK